MEVTGTLKVKMDIKPVSEKFKTRDFVLTEHSSQYPQQISFQLAQDKCALIDNFNAGDEIKVTFNLRGREWSNPQGEVKYFNTLDAWKVEKVGATSSTSTTTSSTPAAGKKVATAAAKTTSQEVFTASNEGDDDLPF